MEGQKSKEMQQGTGIKQGCPLSPYLFIIVMTVLMHDVKSNIELKRNLIENRIPAAEFDEILYADDTILISTNPATINKYIKEIQLEGKKIGLELNYKKCEVITMGTHIANIKFYDGYPMQNKYSAKYLGAMVNDQGNPNEELKYRMADTMATWKKLDIFWREADLPIIFKLRVYDAVVKTKLLYGLESAQLNKTNIAKLDVFQLKGLRKILKMKTTYVERENSNELIYKLAWEKSIIPGKEGKNIVPLSQVYRSLKIKKLIKVIRADDKDIIKKSYTRPRNF